MNLFGLEALYVWLAVILVAIVSFYIFCTWNYNFWKNQGIDSPKPALWFGNSLQNLSKPLHQFDEDLYKKYGRFHGSYEGRQPLLRIGDPETIKLILVKDFYSFSSRRIMKFGGKHSNLMTKFLTSMNGEEWRETRNILTPAFTSGKLKQMSGLMESCIREMNGRIKGLLTEDNGTSGVMDIKEQYSACTMDVIATCAFGYKIEHRGADDPFFVNAKKLFAIDFTFAFILKATVATLLPRLSTLLKLSIFPAGTMDYFDTVSRDFIKRRLQGGAPRNDFLQLLINAQVEEDEENGNSSPNGNANHVNGKKVLTEDMVLAQCMLFLFAGFETTATTLSYAAYRLAFNQDCQKRLIAEVDETFEKHGKLSHDVVGSKMPYLDMVIWETLRMNPPAARLERSAVVDYTFPNGIKFLKECVVVIPVYAMHRDPEFFPDPEKFDPERFTPEEKATRNPFTYLPFGAGPRNCIGMRFALMETKLALAAFFRNYTVTVCDETEREIEYRNGQGVMTPKNGIKLRVHLRQH